MDPPPGDNVETLVTRVALLEAEAKHRRELIDAKFLAATAATKLALEANDKRLDMLNESRGALDDMSQQMARRAELVTAMTSLEDKTFAEIKAIKDKQEIAGRPNYFLGISAFSAILIAIGGLWTVNGLKIDTAISPLIVVQEQLRTGQAAQDHGIADIGTRIRDISNLQQADTVKIGVSAADRDQLNSRLHDVEKSIIEHNVTDQKEISALQVALTRLNALLDFSQQHKQP